MNQCDTQCQLAELKPLALTPLPERPLVSVLTANFNYEKYLGQALESLLAQTWDNWEVTVCDDGSTDNSREVLDAYIAKDSRIHGVFQPNGGVACALNAAYANSCGDIIVLLDADDTFVPTKLEKVISAFRAKPNAGLATHFLTPIDALGAVIGPDLPYELVCGWQGPWALQHGGSSPGLPPASALSFRKDAIAQFFPIPDVFRRGADGYLMGMAVIATEIVPIAEPLSQYRLHGTNITGATRPTAAFYEKGLIDYRRIHEAQSRFILAEYGEVLSSQLRLEGHCGYWYSLLAFRFLAGHWPPFEIKRSLSSVMQLLPDSFLLRSLWKAMFAMPRWMANPLFVAWQGQFRWKRFIPRIVRRYMRSDRTRDMATAAR